MLEQIRKKLDDKEVDAFLITLPANVRYLSKFTTPEDARVFLTQDEALLITDGRYIAQLKKSLNSSKILSKRVQNGPSAFSSLLKGKPFWSKPTT